jgi:hypothetical protein
MTIQRNITMKLLLSLTIAIALTTSACGTSASDATDAELETGNGAATGASARPSTRSSGPVYRDVTIPEGTTLPLSLTSAIASDTSAVEDRVTAELTRTIVIDGRDVLPAGTRLTGHVTDVDESGRVKGRAMIAFRLTSLRLADENYDVQVAPSSYQAAATKGEDATKIGVGAGAGAIIGGLLGGKGGAAKGAAVGGGAGTGVVLATKGEEVRLGSGADVTTRLTAPLTVRVRIS